MRTYLQPGDTIDVVATGPVSSGSFQVVGKMFGFAESAAIAGETYALKVTGVFEASKAAGDAPAQGADLYWSAANSNFTTTAGSNLRVGTAAYPAAGADVTVKLRLSGHY